MTYGKRLDSAMKAANCSRKDLARVLDVTVNAIGMVITGGGREERWLSRENNQAAAKHLKVDPHWLWTGIEPEPVQKTKEISKEAESLDLVLKSISQDRRMLAYQEALQGLIAYLAEPTSSEPSQDAQEAKQSEVRQQRQVTGSNPRQ
jgi:transcriptional regulator with XRE-family HTH domain